MEGGVVLSEAELLETVTNYHGLAVSAMVFYFSIVTAYLVSAHFVGEELERSQAVTITFLSRTSMAGNRTAARRRNAGWPGQQHEPLQWCSSSGGGFRRTPR